MSQKLIRAIKQAAMEATEEKNPTAILYGTVVSESPLSINVDQRFTLPEDFFILTTNVKDYQTEISFDNSGVKNIARNYTMDDESGTDYKLTFQDSHVKNEVTIYNGLKSGEKVMLLRIQGGQRYVVLDRV